MARRRQRKTNRVPQDQRRLRIRGVRRDEPDGKKLSRAFIGLALARAETEARAQAEAVAQTDKQEEPGKGDADEPI